MHLKLTPSASKKLQDFLDTGTPQQLTPGEIIALNTDLPINDELAADVRNLTAHWAQHPTKEPIALRSPVNATPSGRIYFTCRMLATRISEKALRTTLSKPLQATGDPKTQAADIP